ncbi:MAG: hypothetical protein COS85_01770 [Armatimonadetes bacterium CG07_land_8_20_14_0_80_59_28]|nr:MAG: hypothetical protein COS85_01770 [Armatimonadetes bacterium CG07_land_8_20_14_0_80_59_28]PIX45529.1 MAG: hypothetical protein COZ56_01660 [Armatimonadetes bacterium CG_4_8_14_3_um_filter_58_9]PIY44385.1 MAG: hypothetical protein COZ05_08295 [Armatimonadetes bacterium CG_4_10_14_3_um_filter_59_10]
MCLGSPFPQRMSLPSRNVKERCPWTRTGSATIPRCLRGWTFPLRWNNASADRWRVSVGGLRNARDTLPCLPVVLLTLVQDAPILTPYAAVFGFGSDEDAKPALALIREVVSAKSTKREGPAPLPLRWLRFLQMLIELFSGRSNEGEVMKTQAVVFPEADRFELRELQLEPPGTGDMVVRTLVTAISPGTERWTLRGKHIGTQFPCVPGYHRIGIVEECGSDVTNFRTGDIVYGSVNRWKEEVISMWGAHVGLSVGNFGGYKFVASTMPTRFELETLSLEVVAAVGNRGIRFCDPKPTQKMLIIGAGIIGLCAAQLAALRGAAPVLLDVDDERIDFLKQRGYSVFNGSAPSADDTLRELAPAGFDIVYDTAGHAATTDRMVQLMRRQGTLLLQAQYFDKERCAIDLDQTKMKELTVKFTCGTGDIDWEETTTRIRSRMLKIDPLITHRLNAPEQLLEGYELLHTGRPFNLGIVFRWDDNLKVV